MIDSWTLYWVLKLEDIQTACLTLSIIGLAMSILVFIWVSMGYHIGDEKCFGRPLLFSLITSVFFATTTMLSVFIPDTKQMAAILILPEIATQENIDTFTGEAKEIYGIAKKYLIEITGEQEASNETK
jgi:hypothetical protein